MDPLKQLNAAFLRNFVQAVFIFIKIIQPQPRCLTGFSIPLRLLFFKNYPNLFTPLKQNYAGILYPRIL